MISRVRAAEIRSLARETVIAYNGMILPVRPKDIAEKVGILVESFVPPSSDISGFLMRLNNSFGIGYSTAIASTGFQSFTIAHELGHYFIPEHPVAVLIGGRHFSRSGYISRDPLEQEADMFATELLMPWKLIDPLVNGGQHGFDVVKLLADRCGSSLLASGIRYTEVTKECLAVIVSHKGVVEFMTASESFRTGGIGWLHRGDHVPTRVPTNRLAKDESWIAASEVVEEGAYLDDWFESAPHIEVEEDIIGLGSYGRVLSVLFLDWTPEDEVEKESEEDDYIDRWKAGRFRKR
jgi:Zn-dependent peptidase ImmA (M78 family)